jgi:hypothetical protein
MNRQHIGSAKGSIFRYALSLFSSGIDPSRRICAAVTSIEAKSLFKFLTSPADDFRVPR